MATPLELLDEMQARCVTAGTYIDAAGRLALNDELCLIAALRDVLVYAAILKAYPPTRLLGEGIEQIITVALSKGGPHA